MRKSETTYTYACDHCKKPVKDSSELKTLCLVLPFDGSNSYRVTKDVGDLCSQCFARFEAFMEGD